ncbi:FecCD family ABC transporter permease [Virgibacillus salexigens]|uniref:FecCD family ABC transporter permease n=1 Tax=Virgibacillus massiliensis TaxID=1462526 RepID=UPI00136DEC57|nr:iron ABC transporter permease [Virgibacillus massiliensis]MYL40013.1 iron chelate uptake ABC transporter family permease subunit [Virgibacillus massiliensis]
MKKIHKSKFRWTVFILVIGVIISFFLSLSTGIIAISPAEVVQTILHDGTARQEMVLFDFRLPGIILALFIGAGLAVSGSILQGVTQNELADPGILGINTGAGLAVVLFLFFFQGDLEPTNTSSIFLLPIFAFIGALVAAGFIYLLAWKKGIDPIRLVLVGIGINAAFSAFLVIFQLKMDPQNFRQATVWLSGDIWNTNWMFVLSILPWIITLIPVTISKAKTLDVLTLGDEVAAGLGSKIEKERVTLLFLAVALAGASVAAGGAIAFLGLIVPHITRKIIGPLHQYIIPISTLIGGLLLIIADMIAKNLLQPTQMPVGIIVSILSAPYFIYLLMKTK